MNIKTWLSENRMPATLAGVFVIAAGGLGYLSWSAWDDYSAATDEYNAKASDLDRLAHQSIFPSTSNLEKLEDTLAKNQASLNKLTTALQEYRIPFFDDIEKAKPQDQPQSFQDALRNQVTAIKTLSVSSGSTLPQTFYLGLDEYENQLPKQEEVDSLSKQLTALNWIAKTLVSQRGLSVTEFARSRSESPSARSLSGPNGSRYMRNRAPLPSPSEMAYETVGTLQIALRCDQSAFREVLNAISSAPYLLVIEDMKIQNSVLEPPRKDADTSAATDTSSDGSVAIRRLPIIVGRELLNVQMKIRAVDFPAQINQPGVSK
jgi:hypothetical protein